jgi:uncharacterized protein
MTLLIQQRLTEIAADRGFRILYACETGSRGWGFASPDSDYDVRFVYAWPREFYLRLDDPKDNFNLLENAGDDVLDFNAWDIRKLLRHARRSNATVFEWLQSPILYREEAGFRARAWELTAAHFNPKAAVHHYLGIAHNAMKTGISDGQIKIKKYFYILRPLLAAIWAADRRSVPPMEFKPLLTQIEDNQILMAAIYQLWSEKEKAPEGYLIPLVPAIQTFIEQEMERCRETASGMEELYADDSALNLFFNEIITV